MSSSEKANTPKFASPQPDSSLSETFSPNSFKVVGAIVLFLLIALGYKLMSKPSISLLSPINNQILGADELDFQWQSNKTNVSYVVEVYEKENSELVLRQITDQIGYKPDQYQQSFFQKDHNYYWIILSNPDIKQSYQFKTTPQYFSINKAVEMPPTPVVTPIPLPSPTPQQSSPSSRSFQDL